MTQRRNSATPSDKSTPSDDADNNKNKKTLKLHHRTYLLAHNDDRANSPSRPSSTSTWAETGNKKTPSRSLSFDSIDLGADTIGKSRPLEEDVPEGQGTVRKNGFLPRLLPRQSRFLPPQGGWRDHWIFQCSNHVANFGSQYNLACLSLGIQALTVNTLEFGPKEMEEPYWVRHLMICFVFVGACMGMIIMGMAGDFIGPRWSMMVTCLLGIVGIVASALIPGRTQFWPNLAICRFVVGFALGGAFPLAATNASADKNKTNTNRNEGEGSSSDAEAEAVNDTAASKRVGWAFFWQSPGAMSPYIVGLALLQVSRTPMTFFRLLMSFGIIPNLYVFICSTLHTPKTNTLPESTKHDLKRLIVLKENRKLNMRNRDNWAFLVGTGGSWFIFDMTYYGIFLFAPELIMNMFDDGDPIDEEAFGLNQICRAGAFATGVGIFGGFAAVHSLKYLGAKRLNSFGFIFIACMFTLLAIARLIPLGPNVQLALFATLALSLNYGPNIATYVLPTRVFPTCVQSTFHGWSSACGKAGALTGTMLFPVLRDHLSISSIMFLCAVASLVGTLITELFVPAIDSGSIRRRTLQYVPPRKSRDVEIKELRTGKTTMDEDDPCVYTI